MRRFQSMGCPECGSLQTKVVATTPDASGQFMQIQRVKCQKCDHRWYSAIPHPVVIPYVKYEGKGSGQRCYVPVAS
jgi:transcriptional regulator NrdR family protein